MELLIALDSLLRNLQAAVKSVGLYPPSHPTSARFLNRILEDLEAILGERDSLVLGVVDRALVALDIPFTGTEPIALAFAERLEERGIGSIEFHRGCQPQEVSQCAQVLAMQSDAFKRLGRVEEILGERGVRAIRLSEQVPARGKAEQPGGKDDRAGVDPGDRDRTALGRALRVYREAVGSAKRILTEARMGKIPSLAEAQATVAGLVDGVLQDQNLMLGLTMIKGYDEYLFNHSVNVGVLCIALGQSLGFDSETIKELGLGAFLHDVGKVQWPGTLYQKPRGLSDEEWALVQRHPLDGAETVKQMGDVSLTTLEVILEHHLRFDRKGYPILDAEKQPGFFGMIGQLADSYDAMTTTRIYQNAREPSRAVARMQSLAGAVFEPKLLDAFIRMVGIYPVGSLVRLSSGELALVVRPNSDDSSRPIVRLLFDRTGRRLAEEQDVSLTDRDQSTGQFRRTIVLAVDAATKDFDVAKYLITQGEVAASAASSGSPVRP